MNTDRVLLVLVLLLQALLFGGLVYVYEQVERRVIAPASNAAQTVRDATTILTKGPINGAMYVAQHPQAAAFWSKASGYLSAAADKLRASGEPDKTET